MLKVGNGLKLLSAIVEQLFLPVYFS